MKASSSIIYYLRSKKYRFLISLATTILLISCVYNIDLYLEHQNLNENALSLSRQVALQAESLSLNAAERNQADPIGWATTYLNQGTEPKLFE
ncbi:MAG: hypothetical protein HY072_09375, partial [Deltaproteobacteria bacterium]|nr:hypothetical protein [Deltaproteobacteria bacterium]